MTASIDHKVPDPAALRELVLERRGAFGTYNVARLGELIRRLPEEKRKSFETVPLLLHLNAKGLPGYVDHPRIPHGIYRFSDSGFWKMGRRRLGIEEATIQSFLLKRYYVRGIYLVGSSGTQAQTEISDLNYWVVIDRESVDEEQRELLSQKLDGIKEWAREDHGQALTFLVLDLDQVRQNDFSAWTEPFVALPQGSLMKEEFYRTFILIAGHIPFWAVLPDGLNEEEYDRWTKEVGRLSGLDFVAEDYVDLGPVTSINRKECPGAILSEISRFRQDPVRSLIKASLLAHHCFFREEQGLLCENIKLAFSKPKSGGESPDPSVFGFERAVRFYETIDDPDGFDLIKRCVYLRLSGYPGPCPPKETDPNRDVLNRFRRQWAWSSDQGDQIESYGDWTEAERLGMEDRILHKLWFLFHLMAKAGEEQQEGGETGPSDLDPLRNRAEERLASKPGQIPYASAYLRARRDSLSLRVEARKDPAGGDRWAVYDQWRPGSREDKPSLFSDPQLLRVLAWIVMNGLYSPERSSVVLRNVQSAIVARRAEAFLKDMQRFFPTKASAEDLRADPAWVKLLVVLDIGLGPQQRGLTSVDFLIRNTWGEMFYLPLDLGHVENKPLRCYEVASRVRQYQGQTPAGEFEYQIYHSRSIEDAQTAKNIEECIGSFRNDNPGETVI